MKVYVFYDPKDREVVIRNVPINKLKTRMGDFFSNKSSINLVNGEKYLLLFNKMEYLTWEETELRFFSYFALEVYEIFNILATEYSDITYQEIAEQLMEKTWIGNYRTKDSVKIDTLPLLNFNPEYKLKDFQLEFVKNYPSLKYQYDLRGYILSLEQGLGKTLTSIALGECLKKEIFYIICPNSLKNVWADEIKKYYIKYKNNADLWKKEVCIGNDSSFPYNKETTKFIIINQESIPVIYNFVDPKKDSILIVDESQNFRGATTKRVASLLKLREIAGCNDVLLMSGTPVKATANEIVPALLLIDPHFTQKLADIYIKTFSSSSVEGSAIARPRFRRVIYRKLKKDVLKLPEKYVEDLSFKVPKPERFFIGKCREDILKLYHEEYIKRLKTGIFTNNKKSPYFRSVAPNYDFIRSKSRFESIVLKFSRAKREITEAYIRKIFQESEDQLDLQLINSHNVEKEYFAFLNKYVIPFVDSKADRDFLKNDINGLFGWSVAAKSASGMAIGKIINEYKNACFSEIWRYNKNEIINMILRNDNKTIIFSTQVPVVELLANELEKAGIECIKVVGSSPKRTNLIKEFKNNKKIKVLVATTQTLSTGQTFVEANQVFFFGTPYRYSDFEQAYDRVHRIGQTNECYIYNILLHSVEKNITGRIEEILNWSNEMFDSLINEGYLPI